MIPATEERLTIEPPPLSFIARTASRQPRNVPSTLTALTLRQSASVACLDVAEDADAGAVDQDVKASKRGEDGVDHFAPARFVGHVLGEHEISVRPERLKARFVSVGRSDLRALGVEQSRRRPANAGRRASDERDLAGETSRPCSIHDFLQRSVHPRRRRRKSGK